MRVKKKSSNSLVSEDRVSSDPTEKFSYNATGFRMFQGGRSGHAVCILEPYLGRLNLGSAHLA